MSELPRRTLHDGVEIPCLGLGVFRIDEAQMRTAVRAALDAGYRLFDTATLYGNEAALGAALRDSGVPREELFVTTKVWNGDQGHDETLRAFDASAERLGLGVVDLYLVHWPAPALGRYVDTWRALVRLRDEGRVRSIGVSNFQPEHLERIVGETGVVPTVNQVERHPYLQQHEVVAADDRHGVLTEAWSPLAKGRELLADPVVGRVASRRGCTPAQVVLAWHLATGSVPIPKSVTPARIVENARAIEVELDEADLLALAGLDRGGRVGPDPDQVA